MIFSGLEFWQKRFFGVYERCRDFFGVAKKNRGTFLVCNERTKGFFWYAKKK